MEAKRIYHELESELKEKSAKEGFDHGISIPEITSRYKGDRSEDGFKKKILPYLENYRKNNKKVAVFSKTENARKVSLWQYKK